MISCGLKIKENCHELVNQFHGNYHSKPLVVGKFDQSINKTSIAPISSANRAQRRTNP